MRYGFSTPGSSRRTNRKWASVSFKSQIETAIATARKSPALDEVSRFLWRGHAEGALDDEEADRLSKAIEARRAAFRNFKPRSERQAANARPRPCVSPDRAKSLARRRRLVTSGAVPPNIACSFTMGELAVLTVIARECQSGRNACTWFMDRIAAVAGVSRTTARNAIRQAQTLGLISVEERRCTAWRSDSNIIRITGPEWRSWLKLGGGCRKTRSTNTKIHLVGDQERSFSVRSVLLPSIRIKHEDANNARNIRPPDDT